MKATVNKITWIFFLLQWLYCTGGAVAAFTPWDPLIYDTNYGPSWLVTHPNSALIYAANGGGYQLGLGTARADGGARGMNALTFVDLSDPNSTGHLESLKSTGRFAIRNTGRHTFNDVLLLTAIDANSLPSDFSFSIVNDCPAFDCNDVYHFDNANDFTFYDPNQLNYATGRPSGFYWATSPDSEPISYLFDAGMVTVFAFKGINLGSNQSVTIDYAFENLRTSVVFGVYGYDAIEGYIYHTNRAQLDNSDPAAAISTFAVIPQPPESDIDGDWHVNMMDFAYFSSCWMQPAGSDPNEIFYKCDFDGNGSVYIEDLLFFADQFLDGSAK